MSYKTKLSIFFIFFMAISCNNRNCNRLIPNIEIQSQDLKDAILEYDSIIHTDSVFSAKARDNNYLLTVYERKINDSITEFAISFSLDTWLMQGEPAMLANIGGKDVVFYSACYPWGIIATNGQFHKEITRRHFPEEYMLLDKDMPLSGTTTNHYPSLVLTFSNNKYISKSMTK